MADIYHQVIIKGGKTTLYQAITSQEGLSKWWMKDCTAKPEIGFINEFRAEDIFINKMQNIELVENEKVVWNCLNENDDWTNTKVIFEISNKDDQHVQLDFRHTGYLEANGIYATCNYHWARHLFMLKYLCENGASMLDQDDEMDEVRKVHGQ